MPAAHTQHQHIDLLRHYPDHSPRAKDPHYRLFNAAKRRLKEQGLWKCVIANEDCAGPTQLHHAHVEFAYQNAVDIGRLNELLGLHLDEQSFAAWVESPGNLEPLCERHHLGIVGVHLIPSADWDVVRVHKEAFAPVVVDRPTKEHT